MSDISIKSNSVLSSIKVPEKFPFPYVPEKFTSKEKKILTQFFTNYDKPVFAIFNLPQEVVGAMFSRYSRTAKSVRRLFLDEFCNTEALRTAENTEKNFKKAKERTADFYKRVFAEFGDDSVIQMGSVHIAFEYVSQLIGAKAVEDQRIGASYIEKSTRYVDFGSFVNGHRLFMEPPEIMRSSYSKRFIKLNNALFDAYANNMPKVLHHLKNRFPLDAQKVEDTQSGKLLGYKNIKDQKARAMIQGAYERSIKAKTLDTIRPFLPLTTVTNLGAHFSGQSAENTINKMLSSSYVEVRLLGVLAYQELSKVIPNFLHNIDHPFGEIARNYRKEVRDRMSEVAVRVERKVKNDDKTETKIIDYESDADVKIASQILYTSNRKLLSKKEIVAWCKRTKKKKGKKWSPTLIKIISSAVPDRRRDGRNRRQKLPRAFEHAYVEVEFFKDIGTYKDLQRNRLSSTERQFYKAEDFYIPPEFKEKGMEEVLNDYLQLSKETMSLQKKLLNSGKEELINASEYVTLLGNKVRFNVRANLRQWVFFAELRTIAGGHPTYRRALQEAVSQIIDKMPFMKKIFAHVDWTKDYGLGRLKAEISTQKRLADIKSVKDVRKK